jgi:putative permease
MYLIRDWLQRTFSDPQVVILVTILLALVAAIVLVGEIMAPIVTAVVVAYPLHRFVRRLVKAGLPHRLAVWLVFLGFVACLLLLVTALLPLLMQQSRDLVGQVPAAIVDLHGRLIRLPEHYPKLISADQIDALVAAVQLRFFAFSQLVLTSSVTWLTSLATLAIYLVLVPFLVFFLLRDRGEILAWFAGFLPANRELATRVWDEATGQLDNYIRGKVLEILIVGIVSYLAFKALGLQYATLLGAVSGVSTVLPFIGAVAATVPVAVVAYFQWGPEAQFLYAIAVYVVIHMLDGYALNPLLMSEAVDLHPVAVIVAILFFGAIWGFWGVFFAVPLATVVQAVLRAWPRRKAAADG